ncbi:hypothetical protein F0475_00585 [Prevotella sp. A2879]|uniref:Uncharacterized protein n=1 Tax=Prevotella vespertina TaxID=2608404 RepID=A0A7C9HNY9_9BACT|nr:hypothetical protein [Prevotella vespertina]
MFRKELCVAFRLRVIRVFFVKKGSPLPHLPMERGVDSIVSCRTNNSFTCQPAHSSTRSNHNFEL